MLLQVYVFHPDSTSLLVESIIDFEEAVDLCHELVAVDGYLRAEVWNEAGEQRFGVERAGGTLRTWGALTDPDAPSPVRPPPDRLRALEQAAERALARGGTADDHPHPSDDADLPQILGELPGRREQWFGL
jgi:hypothetical protein